MRRYIFLAAVLLASVAASAQNLNPTVQVTNDYEGKLMEVEKQNVRMAVPDSLLKFDWNFNYSVFDNPYRGAYEFTPYRIDMKPDATVRDNRMLFLRAGAGYSLHPEVQAVFTPAIQGRAGFSLYDDFKGYAGKYHSFEAITGTSGNSLLERAGEYKGHDFANRLGGEFRYDAPTAVITFDAGLDLLRTGERSFGGNSMTGGTATLRARSLGQSDFLYDVSAGWRGLGNKVLPLHSGSNPDRYTEHDAGFDARFIYRLADNHAIRFEPSFHHIVFGDKVVVSDGKPGKVVTNAVDIAPAYVYSDNGFSVRAGLRFSGVWRDSVFEDMADYDGRKLYPDFRLSYEAIPDMLVLSAKVVGGQHFNTYRSYLMDNHHLTDLVSARYRSVSGDATVNAIDAGLGVSGRVGSIFQYGAEAGFARYLNAPMDGIATSYFQGDIVPQEIVLPIILMANYNLIYADLNGSLASDRIDASARLRLQDSRLEPDGDRTSFCVELPLFSGSADLVYNWNRRVFAGLSAEWASRRDGSVDDISGRQADIHVPGWIDLGVTAEFKLNNRFSVWAEGRNLLNKTVMRNFMIAEKGPYFTAGICLNL